MAKQWEHKCILGLTVGIELREVVGREDEITVKGSVRSKLQDTSQLRICLHYQ